MKKLTLLLLVSVILAAFLAVEANAQSSPVSAKQAGGSVVIGKTVRNAQGAVLGKVENIVLSEQGCAEYLILSGKFSGARGRYYPVPWTVVRVTEDPEFLMMDVDVSILREAPVIKDVRRMDVRQWGPGVHNYYVEQHKVGTQQGKKALQGSQDERMKKEHASPSGKPGLKKPTDQPQGKKFHGGQEERGPAERQTIDKEKQLRMKKQEDTARSPQQQEQGQQKQLEKEKSSVVQQERKLDIKPETGHPAAPPDTKKGGPAQGATPAEPGHSGEKIK